MQVLTLRYAVIEGQLMVTMLGGKLHMIRSFQHAFLERRRYEMYLTDG